MIIDTNTIRKITSTGAKMIFSKIRHYEAEEGTIKVDFKDENDLFNYSIFLYENSCSVFDEEGDEIFESTGTAAFDEAIDSLLVTDKDSLKRMMIKALENEDLKALEALINLI